jgi:GNAT superfamily N-acetyltransferase
MPDDNLSRMIRLADEFFETRNDPAQISVTEDVMRQLHRIHPSTLTEENDGTGPIAWIMVIPTVHEIMDQFIAGRITERALLESTPLDVPYEAIYLCSALVLPEHRGKGIARRLVTDAVSSIRNDHPIRDLFYWAFSVEGQKLAESVARIVGLPLLKRLDAE